MDDVADSNDGMRMRRWLLPVGVAVCAGFGLSGALALVLGVALAALGANVAPEAWHRRAHWILQGSVVALGAGICLPEVARAGLDGLGVSLLSISLILILAELMGRVLKVPRTTRRLIGVGTAICGGSAIAAVAGVLNPERHETAASLGIVFLLNAVALALFPVVGHWMGLSETAFGWWAALSIHDTSSVVGAGMAYGPVALTLATTIKLARALWIAPVALAFAWWENRHCGEGHMERCSKARMPWFILGFIGLAALRWAAPGIAPAGDFVAMLGRHGLSAALFLIGAGLCPGAIRQVGWAPALLGVGIWIPSALATLLFVVVMY